MMSSELFERHSKFFGRHHKFSGSHHKLFRSNHKLSRATTGFARDMTTPRGAIDNFYGRTSTVHRHVPIAARRAAR